MGKTVICLELSESGIDNAIRELEQYKSNLIKKTELFRNKIANRISDLSKKGFSSAILDDILNGSSKQADVRVFVENKNNVSIVIASGEDAVWIEFGAGVYHNTAIGSSPHPKASEFGFTIGSYGKGMGSREVWGYYEDGELRLTHGTPATMPIYNSVKIVCSEISKIAREVFK